MGTRDLAVDALAVYRLTRLVTTDRITRPWRVRVIAWAYGKHLGVHRDEATTDALVDGWVEHDGAESPKWAAFIKCPWCVGMWAAFGVIAARRAAPAVWEPVAEALACSTVAGAIAKALTE